MEIRKKERNIGLDFIVGKVYILTFVFIVLLMFFGCSTDNESSLITESDLCLVEVDDEFIDVELDEDPEFIDGGEEGFINELYEVISYPAEARENSIEGLCLINYVITKEGTIENIEAVEEPGGGIGASAVLALSSVTVGTSFSPGILTGETVRVKKELNINYRLE